MFILFKGVHIDSSVSEGTKVEKIQYIDEFGETVVKEKKVNYLDLISGKSIIIKYGPFTIILYKVIQNVQRPAKLTQDKTRCNKSDVTFERVVVLWERNYFEFTSPENNGNMWYEAYHTTGQGEVKGVNCDSACIMFRFRPEMNIKYSYSKSDNEKELFKLHKLFSHAFYIMDYYFENLDIDFLSPLVEKKKNLIKVDLNDGLVIEESLTQENKLIVCPDNNQYNKKYLSTKFIQAYKKSKDSIIPYCIYDKNEGVLNFSDSELKDMKKVKDIINDCIFNEGDSNNIIQDDYWRAVIEKVPDSEKFDEVTIDDSKVVNNQKKEN